MTDGIVLNFIITVLFLIYFIDYAITVVPFSPLHCSPPCTPSHTYSPLDHVHGSYIQVLWLLHFLYYSYPPAIFYLPFMLLILCTFPPLSSSHSPIDNPPCDLYFCDSVPVLIVCLVPFCFCFRLIC